MCASIDFKGCIIPHCVVVIWDAGSVGWPCLFSVFDYMTGMVIDDKDALDPVFFVHETSLPFVTILGFTTIDLLLTRSWVPNDDLTRL